MSLNYDQFQAYIDGLYADGELSEQDYNDIINYILANGETEKKPRDLIQIRRGFKENLPSLAQGEMGVTLDDETLFIGGLNGNMEFLNKQGVQKEMDIKLSGTVNIEEYKHLVDRTNPNRDEWDWTEAFKQAIQDTNGTIMLGAYKYNITDVEVNKIVNIKGASKRNTIINILEGSVNGLFYNGSPNLINNISLSHFQITGAKGLKFYNVHRWTIDNIEISEVNGDGFICDYSWVGSITGCYIHHNKKGCGVKLTNDANAVVITGSEIQGNKYGVFIGNNCLGTTLIGSTIEGNALAAIYGDFVKVLTVKGCYFEKNGFQPEENPPHDLSHIYLKGGVSSKAYSINISGCIFNEIRENPDGTKDGYSIYLDNVTNVVLEGNAYLFNGLGGIYVTENARRVLSLNDFTTDESTLVKGTTQRLTILNTGKTLSELEIHGNIRGKSTGGLFISSEAPSGWATVLQTKKTDLTDTPRLVIPSGTDIVTISTSDNNFYTGNGTVTSNNALVINGAEIYSGTGSPEGVKSAPIGSLYLNKSGGVGSTLFVKESGNGIATGWVAK